MKENTGSADPQVSIEKGPPVNAGSILIILMGSLGDVARGLCVVSPIKKTFPACRITWLVEPRCVELVKAHPQIDEVLIYDRPRGFRALRELYLKLRSMKFDVTLDMQRHFKSGFFSLLSGAPRRIGFHRRNAKEFNWIFNNEHVPYVSPHLPKLENYLKFPELLGAETESIDFGIPPAGFSEKLPAGLSRAYVLLVLAASRPEKNWTAQGYQDLTELVLSQTDLSVCLAGTSLEAELGGTLAALFPDQRVQNFVGRTSLSELIALISQARACTGPDSGPGHVAAMFGVPYVSLFGPTDPDRVAPYGMRHLVVQAPANLPPRERRDLRHISAELVFLRLREALAA